MTNDDKELMNRLFVLAENYAGVKQAMVDVVGRLDSYSNDIRQHKEASAIRDKEILDKITQQDKEITQEIRRLVDGMNKKIDAQDKTHGKRITELESDKKGVKWVLALLLGFVSAAWAFIVKNWQHVTGG